MDILVYVGHTNSFLAFMLYSLLVALLRVIYFAKKFPNVHSLPCTGQCGQSMMSGTGM